MRYEEGTVEDQEKPKVFAVIMHEKAHLASGAAYIQSSSRGMAASREVPAKVVCSRQIGRIVSLPILGACEFDPGWNL